MADWITLILLLVSGLVPGWLMVALFSGQSRRFEGDIIARIFASLILGMGFIGWLALVMAEVGWFSIGRLVVAWIVICTSLSFGIWLKGGKADLKPVQLLSSENHTTIKLLGFLPSWSEYLFLGLWLVVSIWLFFRPHQYILGGADAGVYVNLAANISQTGSILIEDKTMAEMDPALYPGLLRPLPDRDPGTEIAPYYLFPGFYVTDANNGQIMPQFYPLHPVLQAIAYSLGGVEAALLSTGLWAILGSLAVYLVIREIAGWEAAAVGLIGLTLTALQVWFARYPTTEMLAQFLLWAGLWGTIRWLQGKKPAALWSLIAGLALGEVMLVRIDTYFLLLIPAFAWFYLRWKNRWQREDWWFFAPFGVLTLQSLFHARFQSTPYFYNTFDFGLNLLRRNWFIPALILFMAIVALVLFGRFRNRLAALGRYRRPITTSLVILVLLLVVYGWFVRPALGDLSATRDDWYAGGQIPTQLDRENLVRLGWYLSPLGIVLAAAGICLMLWFLNLQSAVLLIIGMLFSILFLWRIQANPHQIYTMRRYVPAVLPFFVIAASYFLGWLMHHQRRLIAISGFVLAFAWIAGISWSARGFVRQVDYPEITDQIENLDRHLEPGSILIFAGDFPVTTGDVIGTPLHFLYGHDVYSLRDPQALEGIALQSMIEMWQEENRSVYLVGDAASFETLGMPLEDSFTITLETSQLENSYTQKPSRVIDLLWRLQLHKLSQAEWE